MKRKLMTYLIGAALCTALATLLLLLPRLYTAYQQQAFASLRSLAASMATGIDRQADPQAYLQALSRGETRLRVSLIAPDGQVLYDSEAEAGELESHGDRVEVQEAFATGQGQSSRLSSSIGDYTLYFAYRLGDGSVLRLSQLQRSLLSELTPLISYFALIILVVIVLSFWVADRLTRRFVKPLESLNLDLPAENDTFEELTPLLRRLSEQQRYIRAQMQASAESAASFSAILQGMSEGLVVLSQEGDILSVNESALTFFGQPQKDFTGRHYVTLCRELTMQEAVQRALGGEAAEAVLALSGRTYQLYANPVRRQGQAQGVVVLLLDITERALLESSRREFSANVSHELKTPLTTIAGAAEMMQAGMVQSGDMQAFSQRIYGEAKRLIQLIDDIIALSKLDEGAAPTPFERVDLQDLGQSVRQQLLPQAEQAGVTVQMEGGPAWVWGSRPVLWEMVYNLLDNAIKYNRPGGSATLWALEEPDATVLRISDSGVGIAPEHQERVFERFYRVDKSHARATGGTGLGLSIVKHGAGLHRAALSMQSREGEGTTITLRFPRGEENHLHTAQQA